MKYYFHPLAEQEFDQAIKFYENEQSGLGIEFSREVYAAIQTISKYPEAWTQIDKKTRRCLIHRFPFGILYRIVNNKISIMAIHHLKKKPGYWDVR